MFKKFNFVFIISLLLIFTTGLVMAAKYEGPVPEEFNQAPMLDEKVASGELPPVEERVPEEPYVVDPINEIGDYGGTLHSATIGINFAGEDTMLMDVMNGFVKANKEYNGVVENFAKEIEISEDNTTYTIHLREGVKWSDGNPFDAEDIMYWYNSVLLNEKLTPSVGIAWRTGGEVVNVSKIDQYTVEFKFTQPKPYFLNRLVHSTGWMLQPAHYMKQFHPDYVDEEELAQKVKEAEFDNWWELYGDKNNSWAQQPLNPERPTLTAYKLVKMTSNRRIYERNPYFWKVDKAGNQLPYIDRIETESVNNVEVLMGKIMSGEIDFAGYNMDIRNYPMLRKYEDKGGYETLLWECGYSNEAQYMVNMTHEDPVLREIFQDVRFRKALSLGIDRQEINDTIYYGKGNPEQFTVIDSSKYFKQEYEDAYAEYDPERAKEFLEEMGLTDTDNDGIRERPDGKNLQFTIEYPEVDTPTGPNVELVTQYWNELGLQVKSKQISTELQAQRAPAGLEDATVWAGCGSDILFPIRSTEWVPDSPGWETTKWPKWSMWFQSNGNEGMEPPAHIKQLHDWWTQMLVEPDPDRREELGDKLVKAQAENLWNIGTIGETPWPITVDKDLRNVPEQGLWSWSGPWITNRDPEQFYFENGVNEE